MMSSSFVASIGMNSPKASSVQSRRGSLPLKKRRFTLNHDEDPVGSSACNAGLARLPETPLSTVGTRAPDNKIAALALVAAASAYRTPLSIPAALESVPLLQVPYLGDSETAPSTFDDSVEGEDEEPASPDSSKRIHHPPLLEPLPGGCHGRTSRNNSYCRRLPCYNGSNYCKLHYQQYGMSKKGHRQQPIEQDEASRGSSPYVKVQAPSTTGNQSSGHQDKRFTGVPDETRCLATTTRGRACAFISVKGTRYCFLHADYDTNPPPRRGGSASPKVQKVKSSSSGQSPFRLGRSSTTAFKPLPSVPSALSTAEVSLSPPPSVASERSIMSPSPSLAQQSDSASSKSDNKKQQGYKGLSRRASARMAEMHAESPYPLLSMMTTDAWFGQRVKIATGPLMGTIGTVEKWGNGWVSVRIPGVGMHNRRSFELYQWPEGKEDEDLKASAQAQQHEQEEDARETPDSFGYTSDKASNEDMIAAHNGASALMVVPETPRQDFAVVSTDSIVETPVPKSDSKEEYSNVTPSPKKSRRTPSDDVPLVERLMLAEEGNMSKHSLGLLFGTAALERGRRTVKKVTRYEDTAMIESNKKGRRASMETKEEPSPKRSRPGSLADV